MSTQIITPVPDSLSRGVGDMAALLAAESLSMKSGFGAFGDNVTDDSGVFATALAALHGLGGGKLSVPRPKSRYLLQSNLMLPAGTVLHGENSVSIIQRDPGTDMPTGKGVIDIPGSAYDVVIKDLVIDGGVTTPTQIAYTTSPMFTPYDARFVKNSSVWIHGGAKHIRIENVTVMHTGGYAFYVDATDGDIEDIEFVNCTALDCRPFTFTAGAWQSLADHTYGAVGSWIGGFHFEGDGDNYGVKNITFRNCKVYRCAGIGFWGHSNWANGLLPPSVVHQNVNLVNCYTEDTGLDGFEMGCISGGTMTDCNTRRSGYVSLTDGAVGTPRWFPSGEFGAVAYDHSGYIIGMTIKNCNSISPNGGYVNLDGFGQGSVIGGVGRVPAVGEPEYDTDSIASFGPGSTGQNLSCGIQSSNSNNLAAPGDGIIIIAPTLIGFGGQGIGIYAGRNCQVINPVIQHVSTGTGPSFAPIAMGPIGTGPYQRATNVTVAGAKISWSPPTLQAAIQEDASITPFLATDKNWVAGNTCTGNCSQFAKDVNSSSSGGLVLSGPNTAPALPDTPAPSYLVFERTASGMSTLTGYQGVMAYSLSYWFDQLSNGTSVVGGPLFNVSHLGTSGSGSISTAGRTALAFDDCIATGRGVFDAFAAFTDTTLGTPHDAAADLLPDTWGLLYYKGASHAFYISTSVTSGHRVWTPFIPSQWTTGSSLIYYNGGKVLIGASTVDGTTGMLQVAGDISLTGAVLLGHGEPIKLANYAGAYLNVLYTASDGSHNTSVYIDNLNGATQAYDIYLRPGSTPYPRAVVIGSGAGEFLLPGADNQASIGGTVHGASLLRWTNVWSYEVNLNGPLTFIQQGSAPGTAPSGDARLYTNTDGHLYYSANTGAYTRLDGLTSSQWTTGSSLIYYTGGNVGIGMAGPASALDVTGDIGLTGSLLLRTLGQYVKLTDVGGTLRNVLGMGNDGSGHTDLFVDNTSGQNVYLRPGQTCNVIVGPDGTHAGGLVPNGDNLISLGLTGYRWTKGWMYALDVSGAVTGSNWSWNPTAQTLNVTGLTGTAGINVYTSYVYSQQGFNSDSTATNVLNATGGGVDVKWLLARESLTFVQLASATTLSPSGSARLYAKTDGHLYYSANGGAYIQLDGLVSSQWTTTGSNIYYMTGKVLVGATTVDGTTGMLQVAGDISLTGSQLFVSGAGLKGIDSGGTARLFSYMQTDGSSHSQVYLDNVNNYDIFVRPGSARYVWIGQGGAEAICPNGNNTASCGTTSYRWAGIAGVNIDVSGTATGLVKSIAASGYAALDGAVVLAAGSGAGVTQSGQTITITASGSSQWTTGSGGLIYYSGGMVSVGHSSRLISSAIFQAVCGAVGGDVAAFQNTDVTGYTDNLFLDYQGNFKFAIGYGNPSSGDYYQGRAYFQLGAIDFVLLGGSNWNTPILYATNAGSVFIGAHATDGTTGLLQVAGDVSLTGSQLLLAGAGLKGKDAGGTYRLFSYMATDGSSHSQVYLDNVNNYDVFVRPGSGRYVWIGQGGAEAICPNGNNTASCGTTSYRWAGIAGVNADLSGILQLANGANGVKFYDHYGTSVLTLSSVPVLVSTTYYSNLYLDNVGAYGASIYLRPANGQSVIIGMDGTQSTPAMSALIPNGNASSGSWVAWATLGSATYRWPMIFGTVLDLNAVPGTLAANPPGYVQYPALAEATALRLYADVNARSVYGGTLTYTGALSYSYDGGLYLPLFALSGAAAGFFIGSGVNVGAGSVTAGAYGYWDGSAYWPGATDSVTISGVTLVFKAGLYYGHHT